MDFTPIVSLTWDFVFHTSKRHPSPSYPAYSMEVVYKGTVQKADYKDLARISYSQVDAHLLSDVGTPLEVCRSSHQQTDVENRYLPCAA